jgi:hypothetical protein
VLSQDVLFRVAVLVTYSLQNDRLVLKRLAIVSPITEKLSNEAVIHFL